MEALHAMGIRAVVMGHSALLATRVPRTYHSARALPTSLRSDPAAEAAACSIRRRPGDRSTGSGARQMRPRAGPRCPGRTGRPAATELLWRSSRNPIIPRDLLPRSNSIFNSAVVPFDGGYAGVFRVDDRRPDDEPARGPERRRDRLADRSRADPLRARRRPGAGAPGHLRARLRPAGDLARGPLLRHLVQRLPRADHRARLDARLRDLPPARQRLPAVQPQRRALPAPDRRALRDAQPADPTTGTRPSATSSTRRART